MKIIPSNHQDFIDSMSRIIDESPDSKNPLTTLVKISQIADDLGFDYSKTKDIARQIDKMYIRFDSEKDYAYLSKSGYDQIGM
jgi:hypothetical protein